MKFSENSLVSEYKIAWRNEQLTQLDIIFPYGIPKGQIIATMVDKYVTNGKIDRFSFIGMGIQRGSFKPEQIVAINRDKAITKHNMASAKFGVKNVTNDFRFFLSCSHGRVQRRNGIGQCND